MPLQTELDVFNTHLHEWKEHEGKYVLIHGSDVVDFYSSYEDAPKIGYDKFGLKPFLVKQVHSNSAGSVHLPVLRSLHQPSKLAARCLISRSR